MFSFQKESTSPLLQHSEIASISKPITHTLKAVIPPNKDNLSAAPKDETIDQPNDKPCDKVIIINDILCFTKNKIQHVPKDVLCKISVEFYSSKELAEAKKSLFDNLTQCNERHIQRRGANKSRDDFGDIYRILLQPNLYKNVVFVTDNLGNIPPLDLNNIDILKLLSEIQVMKSHVAMLTESQSEVVAMMRYNNTNVTTTDISCATKVQHNNCSDVDVQNCYHKADHPSTSEQQDAEPCEPATDISLSNDGSVRSYETVSEAHCSVLSTDMSVEESHTQLSAHPPYSAQQENDNGVWRYSHHKHRKNRHRARTPVTNSTAQSVAGKNTTCGLKVVRPKAVSQFRNQEFTYSDVVIGKGPGTNVR